MVKTGAIIAMRQECNGMGVGLGEHVRYYLNRFIICRRRGHVQEACVTLNAVQQQQQQQHVFNRLTVN